MQLIVRNFYERTADVRWWATDDAFYKCLEDVNEESCAYAARRLSIINKFYSVYMLDTGKGSKGHFVNRAGDLVAYARTLGYQEFDGLGWYGVIVQKR